MKNFQKNVNIKIKNWIGRFCTTGGLPLLWVLLALGQLQRLQITPQIAVYGHDLFIGGWLVWYVGRMLKNSVQKPVRISLPDKLHKLIAIFCGWVIVSFGLANLLSGFNFVALAFMLRLALYAVFALSLSIYISAKQLKTTWLVVILVYALTGLLQYLVLPDVRFLAALGWDDHYYRLVGTLFDPAFTGLFFVFGIGLINQLQISARERLLIRAVLLIALALTFSRSSYLAVLTLFCVEFLTKFQLFIKPQNVHHSLRHILKKSFVYLVLIGVFVTTILIAPKPGGEGVRLSRTASITARQSQALSIIRNLDLRTVVLGQGMFMPRALEVASASVTTSPQIKPLPNHARIPDNSLLFILASTGIPGLILFILVISALIKKLWQLRAHTELALLAALAIHSQFNASLVQPFILLFCLTLLVAALEIRKNNETKRL